MTYGPICPLGEVFHPHLLVFVPVAYGQYRFLSLNVNEPLGFLKRRITPNPCLQSNHPSFVIGIQFYSSSFQQYGSAKGLSGFCKAIKVEAMTELARFP